MIKFVLVILSFVSLMCSNIVVASNVCDISNGSGIGGTGSPMHGSGIGGTGAVARDSGSGIGGTGKPIQRQNRANNSTIVFNGSGIGGTGAPKQQAGVVIGTITGFGSICVNGIEIHYTSNTPLQRDGQFVSPESSFAIGQVVAVGVSGVGNEVTATEMHILHSVIGPISSINIANNEIGILGQSVQIPTELAGIISANNIRIGDYIEVSGLRNLQGNIVASRVNQIQPRSTASIRGSITAITTNNFKIQGLTVVAPVPQGVTLGQEIRVDGTINGNQLTPNTITLTKESELTASIGGLVSIEGYVNNNSTDSLEISGKLVDIPKSLQELASKITDHQKVIVTGHLGINDVIILDNVLIQMPEIEHEGVHELNEKQDSHTRAEDREQHQSIEIEDSHQQDGDEKAQYEAPELLERETPEAPEYEAPETPEYEAPEVPEYEAPEVPEYEAPEVPEYEAPEVPEYEAPEVPEYEAPEH